MHKTLLTLISSVLKWGKQNIRTAKWGDWIINCGIREDAVLWSGLCLRSQRCCWPAGTPPAQGSFTCQDFRTRDTCCGHALSLSGSAPLSFHLFLVYLHLHSDISYGSWKLVIYCIYRVLHYIFKGIKSLYIKLPNQVPAKMVQANEKVCKLQLNGWDMENEAYPGEQSEGITGDHWYFFCMIVVECWRI